MLCTRCGSYNADDAQRCTVCGQDVREPNKKVPTGQHAALIFVPGELVAGRYKVLEQLGTGGVGAVYRARDTEVDVDVALKGVAPNLLQTEDEQKLFQKAIKSARKLQHHNIVRIYDEGQHQQPNRRFFTMKLLDGLTLRKIIRLRHDKGQAFGPDEIIPIFQQLAAALDYAHKTTWHGDLKPENVVVLPDLLKITDFGLVKGLPLKPFLGIAKSRSKGFPYIAPELRVEAQHIDGRVDIYSLGVILAEMLTGLVYEGHFSRAFTAALEQLPTRLDGLVRRALAEHPDGRFQKASELLREVETALGALGNTPLPPPVQVVRETPSLPPRANSFPSAPVAPVAAPPALVGAAHDSHESQPEDDDSLLELAQSQVLLLQSEVIRRDSAQSNDPLTEATIDNLEDTNRGERSFDSDLPDLPSDLSSSGLDTSNLSSSEAAALESELGLDQANLDVRATAARLASSIDASAERPSSGSDETLDDPRMRASDDIDTNPGARTKRRRKKKSEKGRQNTNTSTSNSRPGLLSSGDRPPGPDELLSSIYSDESEDRYAPPPVPEDGAVPQASVSGHYPLTPDSDDDEATGPGAGSPAGPSRKAPEPKVIEARRGAAKELFSSEERTADGLKKLKEASGIPEPVAAGRVDGSPARAGARATDVLGLTSDEPPEATGTSFPTVKPVADDNPIHDALTALKRHPRPDLVEDDELRDALTRTAGTGQSAAAAKPPAAGDDDDSMNVTDTLHRPDLQRPPKRKEAEETAPVAIAAPTLRPVAPPRRSGSDRHDDDDNRTSPVLIAAGVAIVVLIVLFAGRALIGNDDGDPGDIVKVTTPIEPVDGLADAGADTPPAPPEQPVPPPVITQTDPPAAPPAPVPAPPPKVDDAKAERERLLAEQRAREEMERREREALLAKKPPPAPPPAPSPSPVPVVAPPPPAPPPVDVAMAESACPSGMATIEAGSFTFGSASSDPMRDFGELDASSVSLGKFCVDFYEAPNGAKTLPTTGVSWNAAKSACERAGKRLCTEQEWERACKGPSNSRFPYGGQYNVENCNTVDAEGKARPLARPADFKKCRSGDRVYMLSGNAEEWTSTSAGGNKVVKGGSADRPDFASRCSARRSMKAGTASGMLGYRCCADPR